MVDKFGKHWQVLEEAWVGFADIMISTVISSTLVNAMDNCAKSRCTKSKTLNDAVACREDFAINFLHD